MREMTKLQVFHFSYNKCVFASFRDSFSSQKGFSQAVGLSVGTLIFAEPQGLGLGQEQNQSLSLPLFFWFYVSLHMCVCVTHVLPGRSQGDFTPEGKRGHSLSPTAPTRCPFSLSVFPYFFYTLFSSHFPSFLYLSPFLLTHQALNRLIAWSWCLSGQVCVEREELWEECRMYFFTLTLFYLITNPPTHIHIHEHPHSHYTTAHVHVLQYILTYHIRTILCTRTHT